MVEVSILSQQTMLYFIFSENLLANINLIPLKNLENFGKTCYNQPSTDKVVLEQNV